MDGLDNIKKAQGIMMIAILLGVVALVMSVVKNFVTEKYLSEKNMVACIPTDIENSFPMVYHQTAINPVQSDAQLKSFVAEYIKLTQNESVVDYHKISSHQRYDKALLSQNKWRAIEMSAGAEKALNMDRYAKSNEIFKVLDQGNIGWVFLIDDILLFDAKETGTTLAVVRGEFQVTYDKIKADLPPRLWGYREIHLLINQGVPLETEETLQKSSEYINQYGLFVTWSNVNILTPQQKEKLSLRNANYYMMQETK